MRTLLIIGIGPGHPDQITLQAIDALNQADVIFVLEKAGAKQDLAQLRRELCDRHIQHPYRIVEAEDPVRDETIPDYATRVEHWHHQRVLIYETLMQEQLTEHQTAAILVWGDPSLFDSTLRIVRSLEARAKVDFSWRVIPGVTAIQALAASHRIPLHGIGQSFLTAPARLLTDELFRTVANIVVVLDGEQAFERLKAKDLHIFWGANLGLPEQTLISGPLAQVRDQIHRERQKARQDRGWVMDTYLLTREPQP